MQIKERTETCNSVAFGEEKHSIAQNEQHFGDEKWQHVKHADMSRHCSAKSEQNLQATRASSSE